MDRENNSQPLACMHVIKRRGGGGNKEKGKGKRKGEKNGSSTVEFFFFSFFFFGAVVKSEKVEAKRRSSVWEVVSFWVQNMALLCSALFSFWPGKDSSISSFFFPSSSPLFYMSQKAPVTFQYSYI